MTSSASSQHMALVASEATQHAAAATAASVLPRPKFCIFFNFKTLLLLQFLIEFANIWTQYCPSTYTSTHMAFFDLCPNVEMAAV